MGKKGKVGKSRRDRFYHLAKETGYRSRAAFKLIQLNRKFEFLQKSNVIIDLCAAPGGWLQVAAENAPMSNHIIGIDLVPIAPINKVTALQEDITTEKCRQALKKQLHTAKADIVMNDGAPNVGTNWVHDAYMQAELTLHALKLATEFLRKGGWFVTKIFRSKDYDSLMWVFHQLFKNVHATKPQASRNESAEIFVVCQNYLAPDTIDPKFLNPKFAFSDVAEEKKIAIDLIHPEKKKRNREGYPEGDYTLFHSLPVTEFFASSNFMDLLAESSEIKLNSKEIENHPLTTTEIKECLKDIKLLGKREIKALFSWRKKLKAILDEAAKMEESRNEKHTLEEAKTEESKDKDDPQDEEEKDMQELEKLLEEKNLQELKAMKKAKKKVKKSQMKQKTRIDMKMAIPGDSIEIQGDSDMFSIENIKNKMQLAEVEKGDLSYMDGDMFDESEEEEVMPKKAYFDKNDKKYVGVGEDTDDEEEMEEEPMFADAEEEEDEDTDEDDGDTKAMNPLLVDMGTKKALMKSKEDTWFSKSVFADLEKEVDEDIELEQMGMEDEEEEFEVKKKKKSKKERKKPPPKEDSDDDSDSSDDNEATQNTEDNNKDDEDDDDGESSGSDSDDHYDYYQANSLSKNKANGVAGAKTKKEKVTKFDGIEVVPVQNNPALQLDEEGLAIGAAMVQSRKRRREIVDAGYHRFMFDDRENLPIWFTEDDQRHTVRRMPVTKAEVDEYKLKSKAIDAQPIKKIAEAKARKKKKMLKSLEKARTKANSISDNVDVSEKEKWNQIKHVYKKAGLLNKTKENVTYVRAKKGAGKKVKRPAGVRGKFKVVDGRMKKDTRGQMKAEKRNAKKGSKGQKAGGKGRGRVRR